MANHSFVSSQTTLSPEEGESLLRKCLGQFLGARFVLDEMAYEKGYSKKWIVRIPDSKPTGPSGLFMKADEDYGFCVWLSDDGEQWEFRHPINHWEHWAQDKTQQLIAKELGAYISDESGEEVVVDPDELRDTYRAYITRNFDLPYTADDLAWFDQLLSRSPEGFRD